MPLLKSASKKAFTHNLEAEMGSGKPKAQSLAIAYDMQRRTKKMSKGGAVPPMPPMSEEARPLSVADAILRKRKSMAQGGEVEPNAEEPAETEDFDEQNEDAAPLEADPAASNESEDPIESDPHDMVAKIRARLKAKRGF